MMKDRSSNPANGRSGGEAVTKEAFETGVIALQDTLYRITATILSRHCDREDAIQECVCKALLKRDRLRDDNALRAWVIRILINECYAILRRQKREHPREQLPEPEAAPDADPVVFRLLFSLEDPLRLTMVLYYVEGYPTDAIARMLRIPAGTVRSRLTRGRKRLKTLMLEEATE